MKLSRVLGKLVVVTTPEKQSCLHVRRTREKLCQDIELWLSLNGALPNEFILSGKVLYRDLVQLATAAKMPSRDDHVTNLDGWKYLVDETIIPFRSRELAYFCSDA
jgi:hypothetical protein